MANIYVGLSGGVDSAVSVALLNEQGHDVTGIFIKIWQPEFFECTWREDRLDAMRVAVALGIPFKEIDLSNEYGATVISDMIEGYTRGETPNPDILCNRAIKYGAFAKWAFSEGADYVATGHYARIVNNKRPELHRGHDVDKDQSYFLIGLTPTDLARALFPIGDLTKKEVRAHASRLHLPVAQKADSQGLCFVGDVSMHDFLRRYIPAKQGEVLNEAGIPIGAHPGAIYFTLGQRHGFSLIHATEKPHFVVALDTIKNTITVSENRLARARRTYTLRTVQWIGDALAPHSRVEAQLRYRDAPKHAVLSHKEGVYELSFMEPVVVAPGQTIAMYKDTRVLGSGIVILNQS